MKERDYEDRLDKMGAKLNFKLDLEERLIEEIGVLRAQAKEASQRAEVEKKKFEDERARSDEAVRKVQRTRVVIKRVKEVETKSIGAVELWRSSPEFDAFMHDAYVVALEEVIRHIHRKRPRFDVAFLEEAVEEQKKEIQRLTEEAGVRISLAVEDAATAREGPPPSSQAPIS